MLPQTQWSGPPGGYDGFQAGIFLGRFMPGREDHFCMSFYRRRLPHWQPAGQALFLTWHLHGSLPRNRFPPPRSLSAGQAFVWMDRYLDCASSGPTWLLRPDIAELVSESIRYAERPLNFYDLHAWIIMSNHVHLLVSPHVAPSRFLQSLKGYTAREANRILERTGQPFWQSESYDHWIRNPEEFSRVQKYIEQNPVRAGLVAHEEQYRWSSAYVGPNADVAG